MPKKCFSCFTILSNDARFCSNCSIPLFDFGNCVSCGGTIRTSDKFCQTCGNKTESTADFEQTIIPIETTRENRRFVSRTQPNRYSIAKRDSNHSQVSAFPAKTKYMVAFAGTVLLIALVGCVIYIAELRSELDTLSNKLTAQVENSNNLKGELTEKDGQLNVKDGQILEKQGTIENKDQELEKKKALVSKQLQDIKGLKQNLSTVSTCFDGVTRAIGAIQTEDYFESETAARQMQSSCDRARSIIEKTAKFRTDY